VPGDGTWGMFTPYGKHRPWAAGRWRGLSRWRLLKSYAIDDWGRHGENASKTVAKDVSGKSTREQRKELAADLSRCTRDAIVALPPGFNMKLLEATANTRDIYLAQIEAADAAGTIGILGQNLTTQVDGGSLAAAKVHAGVSDQRTKFDAESESTLLHGQVLPWYAEINYGDRRQAPWPVRDTEPKADLAAKATVLYTVSQAVERFERVGLSLDREALTAEYGIQFAEPDAAPTPDPSSSQKPQQRGALPCGAPRAAAGFVEGQTYTDALTGRCAQRGAEALTAFVGDMLKLVDGIEDIDDARQALVDFYGAALEPEDLAEKAERLWVLGQLAGMASVRQDAPELDAETPP